jgi:hypothetical protein
MNVYSVHTAFNYRKHSYFLTFAAIFLLAELLVNPVREFPLNDDWSYAKSVYDLLERSVYNIGPLPAMTLWTHLMWGQLFTKLFGFSMITLRFSTIISSLMGFLLLFRLVTRISGSQSTALLACLVILFNPVYFNLVNTFMTDVNFNTLLILCAAAALHFFETKNKWAFILVFVLSALLVLTRQYGIIFPAAFTFTCLVLKNYRRRYFFLSALGSLLVFGILKYYESYLATILPPGSYYEFSGKMSPLGDLFWDRMEITFVTRWKQVVLLLLLYSAPFASIAIVILWKNTKKWYAVLSLVVAIVISFLLFNGVLGLVGNIFTNMSLGAETFYENVNPVVRAPHQHTFSFVFERVANIVQIAGSAITIHVVILLFSRTSNLSGWQSKRPAIILLSALIAVYVLMLLITSTFFDRYLLPLQLLIMLLFACILPNANNTWGFAVPWLIVFAYISIAGTRDYLELNDKRWQAYYDLRAQGIPAEKINGGYEVNSWHDGKPFIFYDHIFLDSHDYLIQYRQEPGFVAYREYPFRRYFPYKKDKINIFVRQQKE